MVAALGEALPLVLFMGDSVSTSSLAARLGVFGVTGVRGSEASATSAAAVVVGSGVEGRSSSSVLTLAFGASSTSVLMVTRFYD